MRGNPHIRRGRKEFDFDKIQTRGVLAGAYRGKDIAARPLKTHIVFINVADDPFGSSVGCRQPLDNIVDQYGYTVAQLRERPTCEACAKKYDELVAEHGESILEPEVTHKSNQHRRNAELTADEQAVYEEIVEDEAAPADVEALLKAVERFRYTSTALYALAEIYLEDFEDADGNLLLLRFAEEFAKHEAKTV